MKQPTVAYRVTRSPHQDHPINSGMWVEHVAMFIDSASAYRLRDSLRVSDPFHTYTVYEDHCESIAEYRRRRRAAEAGRLDSAERRLLRAEGKQAYLERYACWVRIRDGKLEVLRGDWPSMAPPPHSGEPAEGTVWGASTGEGGWFYPERFPDSAQTDRFLKDVNQALSVGLRSVELLHATRERAAV